jgi:hypothetical protein
MQDTEAIILNKANLSPEDRNAAKILDFFGVGWQALDAATFPGSLGASQTAGGKRRLLCSAEVLGSLFQMLQRNPDSLRHWEERVHSLFVYAGDAPPEALEVVLRSVVGDGPARVRRVKGSGQHWDVSGTMDDICGVLSGLRVPVAESEDDAIVVCDLGEGNAAQIISVATGGAYLMLRYHGVPLFFSTGRRIVDIEAVLTSRNFDVRPQFLSVVPIVMYVKWAFEQRCWKAPEINACLMIDDPVLRPRYGFVRFRELLELMHHHNFSTNIAFIPWNWRRNHRGVVRLFTANPDRFSLSVHGCDHTGREFGSRDRDLLSRKVRKAADRMRRHETSTGIRHDRLMVFPQGVFSEDAIGALKQNNFIAAVNTEVINADPPPRNILVSSVWDVAVMDYWSFPIFTRRYPSQGVENFAFDILLGKPCIVVIHHDFCRDRYRRLVEFIDGLNALKCPLAWRPLGEVVRRSCRQREIGPHEAQVEMYGSELRLANKSTEAKSFAVGRRESDPSSVAAVLADAQPLPWDRAGGSIRFKIEVKPQHTVMVRIVFREGPEGGIASEGLSYEVKTALRRYLSEVRDNYLMKIQQLGGQLRLFK